MADQVKLAKSDLDVLIKDAQEIGLEAKDLMDLLQVAIENKQSANDAKSSLQGLIKAVKEKTSEP
jgi:hypothetical protein